MNAIRIKIKCVHILLLLKKTFLLNTVLNAPFSSCGFHAYSFVFFRRSMCFWIFAYPSVVDQIACQLVAGVTAYSKTVCQIGQGSMHHKHSKNDNVACSIICCCPGAAELFCYLEVITLEPTLKLISVNIHLTIGLAHLLEFR